MVKSWRTYLFASDRDGFITLLQNPCFTSNSANTHLSMASFDCRRRKRRQITKNRLKILSPNRSKRKPTGTHLAKNGQQRYWRNPLADFTKTTSRDMPISHASYQLIGISDHARREKIIFFFSYNFSFTKTKIRYMSGKTSIATSGLAVARCCLSTAHIQPLQSNRRTDIRLGKMTQRVNRTTSIPVPWLLYAGACANCGISQTRSANVTDFPEISHEMHCIKAPTMEAVAWCSMYLTTGYDGDLDKYATNQNHSHHRHPSRPCHQVYKTPCEEEGTRKNNKGKTQKMRMRQKGNYRRRKTGDTSNLFEKGRHRGTLITINTRRRKTRKQPKLQ